MGVDPLKPLGCFVSTNFPLSIGPESEITLAVELLSNLSSWEDTTLRTYTSDKRWIFIIYYCLLFISFINSGSFPAAARVSPHIILCTFSLTHSVIVTGLQVWNARWVGGGKYPHRSIFFVTNQMLRNPLSAPLPTQDAER